MNFNKKAKLKEFWRTKWPLLLGTGAFLTIGVVAMLVGFSLTGWSIIKWLQSPYAVTTLIFLVIGGFLLFILIIFYKRMNLMK